VLRVNLQRGFILFIPFRSIWPSHFGLHYHCDVFIHFGISRRYSQFLQLAVVLGVGALGGIANRGNKRWPLAFADSGYRLISAVLLSSQPGWLLFRGLISC